jgi:adenylosuccinate synthase
LQFVNEEFENFNRNYNDFDKARTKLYEEMSSEVNKLKEVQELTEVNKNLIDYIETLEKNNSMKCQGEKFHEVGKKQ